MGRLCTVCCVLAVIAGTLTPLPSVAQTARSQSWGIKCSVPQEEVALFKSYLGPESSHSSHSDFIVASTYVSPQLDIDSLNLGLAAQSRAMPPDVREDFKKKNGTSCNIVPFTGIEGISFVTESELDLISKQGRYEFEKRFAKKSSLITFSRVGFNKDHTLALMHVSWSSGPYGSGTLYLFERKQNKWVVKTELTTWTT